MNADFTSWNENKDISAFGDGIVALNLKDKDDFELLSGTSFASPCVAGIIGLLKSYDYTLSCDRIEEIIKQTATARLSGEYDNVHTGGVDGSAGIINAKKALDILLNENDNFSQGDFKNLAAKYEYTGKKIKPAVKVYIGNKLIDKNLYTLSYSNNKKLGTATVIAKGKGVYAGKTFRETFQIVPAYSGKIKTTLSGTGTTICTVKMPAYSGEGTVVKYGWVVYMDGIKADRYDSDSSKKRTVKIEFDAPGKYLIQCRAKVKINGTVYYTKYLSK